MDLRGKFALVTGAGRRVGKVIALGLASRGMHVLVHYNRSREAAVQTAGQIRAMGVQSEAVQANLGNPIDIEQLFMRVDSICGCLSLLVNSASTFIRNDALDSTVDEWNYVMAVNLRAPFLCSQHAARQMLHHAEPGVIVNIADVAGQIPWADYPLHSISKAGLIMQTQVLAKSLGPDIRVNAVVPGPVLKPEQMSDQRWDELGAHVPLRRTGQAENVVEAVVALVANDYITGAVLNVDGGDSLVGSIDKV